MNVKLVLRDAMALLTMPQEPIDDGKGGKIEWFKICVAVDNHTEEFNIVKEYADLVKQGQKYNFIVQVQDDLRFPKQKKFKIVGIEGKTLPSKEVSEK